MSKDKKNKMIMACIATCVFIVILLIIVMTGKVEQQDRNKVGFIMSGSVDEEGWNGMHYKAIEKACKELDVELEVKENIREFTGECKDAIKELADNGANMIVLSSYGYSEEVKDVVKEYPEIVFYGNSSEYHEDNMTSYFVRMYQARYLSGILAGMRTESNRIGYVAAMSNNEVNRGISAFTLGVRRVNPEAKVIVAWTGEWDDRKAEEDAAWCLLGEQVDVMTYHQNQTYVSAVADAAGIASIGYHQMLENGSEQHMTAVICNWECVYEELIRSFLRGKGNEVDNYWIGLQEEAVGLAGYSEGVSKEEQEAIEKAKTEILSGKDVFSGVIYDTEGTLRCDETEIISDEILLEHFEWFAEGVEFYEE